MSNVHVLVDINRIAFVYGAELRIVRGDMGT